MLKDLYIDLINDLLKIISRDFRNKMLLEEFDETKLKQYFQQYYELRNISINEWDNNYIVLKPLNDFIKGNGFIINSRLSNIKTINSNLITDREFTKYSKALDELMDYREFNVITKRISDYMKTKVIDHDLTIVSFDDLILINQDKEILMNEELRVLDHLPFTLPNNLEEFSDYKMKQAIDDVLIAETAFHLYSKMVEDR